MDRYNELKEEISRAAKAVLYDVNEADLENMMPYLGMFHSKRKVLAEFKRYYGKTAETSMVKTLSKYKVKEGLEHLSQAIEAAYIRRDKYGRDPASAPASEQPVMIARLSPDELINAKLRPSRQEWLEELNSILGEARDEQQGLQQAIKVRRQRLSNKQELLQEKLALLEEAAKNMSDPPGPDQSPVKPS